MILTVTANPALDKTLAIPPYVRGGVLRSTVTSVEPSGKGVNVSVALARHGVPTRALLPVGGAAGDRLLAGLGPLRTAVVRVAGETRTNISLLEPGGSVTKVNEPGPELGRGEVEGLLGLVAEHAAGTDWVVTCGSLPPGAPPELHARIVERARAAGARCAVDASGEGLRRALPTAPDLLKPNVAELAELLGRGLSTVGEVRTGCAELLDQGVGAVLVSLGSDGALLATQDETVFGTVRPRAVVSTVGAGDALLAGYLAGAVAGLAAPDRLRQALRWAGAAVASATTAFDLGEPPEALEVGPPPADGVRLSEPALLDPRLRRR